MASKIYPFGIGNSLEASFKLPLVAEGFTSTQRGQFAALCVDLVEALLSTTPFNRTRARPEWLSVIMAFSASAGAGPRLGSVGASSTVLGSYIDTSTNRLVVDHAQLTTLLQAQVITTETGTQPLSDYFSPGGVIYGITGGLIAVITPAVSNPAAGADDHVQPAVSDQYHLVATTANGLWNQVVLRGIAATLGLADEFERADSAFAAATDTSPELANAPNVVFSDNAPVMNSDFVAWRPTMSPVEWLAPAQVHPRPSNDLPNTAVPAAPYAADKIAFWEGGAGYRRKAYRAAEDCLMRRAPGLGYLPARAEAVAFCPVCISHIRSVIG